MGTTANYSWPTPVASDLVKDGWEAIKDLGDAADTTVKAVSDAQGLVHINTTSFSGVSSQSVNNVFSATYTNYKVLLNVTGSTTNQNLQMRLRVGGSDNSTSNYGQQLVEASSTSASGIRDSGQSVFNRVGVVQSGKSQFHWFDISNPFQTEITTLTGGRMVDVGTASAQVSYMTGGFVATTSFDGFSIFPASGSMTGSVSIYAYRI